MIVAKIYVDGVKAVPIEVSRITKGLQGAQIEVEYSKEWESLNKTAVFAGAVVKDVLNAGGIITIPAEVTGRARSRLAVGFYGVDADRGVVIPTLWVDLGIVQDGADPSGDASTDPALPVWEQIRDMIGNLSNLDTEAKSSLVAAINELVGKTDPEEIDKIITAYLKRKPPEETDPTVPEWAKQPEKPSYTAEEVGALSPDDLKTGIDQALEQAKESGLFDGAPGKDGKSAYQYAQDGGYTGTEEEFAELMASGTGGGVTSWNDLTDKPFYEEENAVLLPVTQFAQMGEVSGMPMFGISGNIDFVVGKTYTVNWNGVDYTTECFMGYFNGDCPMLGNPAAVGGESNNLPFTIAFAEAVIGAIPLDGSTSVTVGITGYHVEPIPTQFVPYAYPYYVEVTATTNGDTTTYTTTETVSNLTAVLNSGRDIKAKVKETADDDGTVITAFFGLTYVKETENGPSLFFVCNTLMGGFHTLIFEPTNDGFYSLTDNF